MTPLLVMPSEGHDMKTWEDPLLSKDEQLSAAIRHIAQLEHDLERANVGNRRYEVARRMNPRQWADAWHLSTRTGKPFDTIVDELRPHMKPNV